MFCKTCDYIRSHSGNDVNIALLRGDSISSIMLKTGLGRVTITRHRNEHHMSKSFLPQVVHTKAAKEQLDLMKCQKEIYDMSIKAGKMALGEIELPATADLRSFGSCLGPATKVVEVLAKVDTSKDDQNKGASAIIAFVESERAKDNS